MPPADKLVCSQGLWRRVPTTTNNTSLVRHPQNQRLIQTTASPTEENFDLDKHAVIEFSNFALQFFEGV